MATNYSSLADLISVYRLPPCMSSNNKKHTKQLEIKMKLHVHKNYIKIRRDNGVRPRKTESISLYSVRWHMVGMSYFLLLLLFHQFTVKKLVQ